MIASRTLVRHRPLALAGATTTAVCGLALALVVSGGPASAAATDVPLASTAQFAVLAGAGITNTGPTTVTGDVGSFPTTSITGVGPGADAITPPGSVRGGDAVVQGAKPDLVIAYDNAAAAQPPTTVSGNIGGQTLVEGVYTSGSSLGLTGTLTLDGQGRTDSVFIFQVGSDFTTASNATVSLVNGAQACHVYWQVAGSATFGTDTMFKGNVLALTSITANTRAIFEGRLLARDGAVTLDTNTITLPTCAPVVTTPAPTVTATTPAPTASATAPSPTRSSPTTSPGSGSGGGSGSGDDSSSSGGSGDGSGGSGGSGSSDGDADGSSSSTGIPDTGGPSRLLVPVGLAAVVAGTGIALASRRRRGAHRA